MQPRFWYSRSWLDGFCRRQNFTRIVQILVFSTTVTTARSQHRASFGPTRFLKWFQLKSSRALYWTPSWSPPCGTFCTWLGIILTYWAISLFGFIIWIMILILNYTTFIRINELIFTNFRPYFAIAVCIIIFK